VQPWQIKRHSQIGRRLPVPVEADFAHDAKPHLPRCRLHVHGANLRAVGQAVGSDRPVMSGVRLRTLASSMHSTAIP